MLNDGQPEPKPAIFLCLTCVPPWRPSTRQGPLTLLEITSRPGFSPEEILVSGIFQRLISLERVRGLEGQKDQRSVATSILVNQNTGFFFSLYYPLFFSKLLKCFDPIHQFMDQKITSTHTYIDEHVFSVREAVKKLFL